MRNIKHVALIMDGNGRWAKKQKLARTAGHFKGSENVRNITIKASELGLQAITLYAFSTENWKRPEKEVSYLMKLPAVFFENYLAELMENNVKVTAIGDLNKLPKDTLEVMNKAFERTKNNTGLVLNFALNYGSIDEIHHSIEKVVEFAKNDPNYIYDRNDFEDNLYTSELPSIDLLIRTSGEQRLSNFLLYQLAYSELMFVDVAWPIFTADLFEKCLNDFASRDRRFGGLNEN